MNEEAWTRHPAVRRVLSQLLDRLDAQPLDERQRAPRVRLNAANVPELYGEQASDAGFVWGLFRKSERAELIAIRLGPTKGPGYADYERSPQVVLAPNAEPSIRALLDRPDPLVSGAEAWRRAVLSTYSGSQASKQFLLMQYPIQVKGRTPEEIVRGLNSLHSLEGQALFLREVSSRVFWGLSKVLDNRASLVAGVLGLPECPFPEAPVQLQVHAVQGASAGVLFIENQTSFEAARRERYAETRDLVLIQGAGFRAGAKRLRTPEGSSLYYSAEAADAPAMREWLEAWLYRRAVIPVFFWGDLDYSGMAILRDLKAIFPNLEAWQPGYAPMLTRLNGGGGHLPDEAGKAGQLDPGATGCSYADQKLLPAIRLSGRFVDQE